MYKVIEHFTDLHDKDHPYQVGDIFPRVGIEVSEERLAELAGKDNKRGVALIELVEEDEAIPPTQEQSDETPTSAVPKPKRGAKVK